MKRRGLRRPGRARRRRRPRLREEGGRGDSERGRFAVALAGGSTPKATYEVLARDHAEDVDWPNVHVFFGDERTVPPDHEDSNYRMAREALLDHVPVGSVHRMRGELPPEEAAASYEDELREFFGERASRASTSSCSASGRTGTPRASSPRPRRSDVTDRLVVANPVPKLDTTRLTLTVPAIERRACGGLPGRRRGQGRGPRGRSSRATPTRAVPGQAVVTGDGGPTWFVDRRREPAVCPRATAGRLGRLRRSA